MNDQEIEREIQAKGKTAPRITPANIEANIASEHYFTAEQGAAMATADQTGEVAHPQPPALRLLTFCVLVLRNGFTVTGESACASPENFDAEIGRNIARQNAVQKIWPLMGYELKQRLCMAKAYEDGKQAAMEAFGTPSGLQPHQQRVVDEKAELDGRWKKLGAFFGSTTFVGLDAEEQSRQRQQFHAMTLYSAILGERIEAFAVPA
jgi:hypothetical protein